MGRIIYFNRKDVEECFYKENDISIKFKDDDVIYDINICQLRSAANGKYNDVMERPNIVIVDRNDRTIAKYLSIGCDEAWDIMEEYAEVIKTMQIAKEYKVSVVDSIDEPALSEC